LREKYAVQVDINAKIEDWEKDSVIAVANHKQIALRVRAQTKRDAAKRLRRIGRTEPIQFQLMAILAYIALRSQLANVYRITLDRDYSGDNAKRIIARQLTELIRRDFPKFKSSTIRIDNVEGSAADRLAREVFKGLAVANGEITLADIESVM
jgi:hypothetical protein